MPLRTILENVPVEFMQNVIMLLLTCGAKSTFNFSLKHISLNKKGDTYGAGYLMQM